MMNKKLLLIGVSTTLLFGSFIGVLLNQSAPTVKSTNGTISLILENNKISTETSPYNEEISSIINTNLGNQLEIKASNVIDYQEGWQTILPNGYFYNPLNSSAFKNKITGITSIKFESEENKTLSLYYGTSLDNTSVMYSHEKTLTPNVSYNLENESPNYFYIKNNNNSNVDIDSFSITYSCIETNYPKQDLNILMIGNSFADDTIFYAVRVAASYGINLNIYNSYISGCTIDQHYNNLLNDTASYSMRSMNGNTWDYQDNMTLASIINSHTWDIVTFQQASAEVGRPTTYSNLSNLVSEVRTLVGASPKFYWHQTWAYDSDYHDYYDYFAYFNNDQVTMYNAIVDCYENQVLPLGVFEGMIPAGTAVQNLRTSYMKETTSRDGKHMSSVHGRYLLALNFVSTIYDIDLDMSPCSYLPLEANASYKNPAYEAIRNAYKNPLAVTNSVYTNPDLGEYNLSNYTEIDAELVGCSYWNSTDGSNYNKRLSNVSGSSNCYVSTKRFTSSDLPIGSLVVIDEAFGVRPEAWVSDSQQASRPAETYQNVIEIDSSFFAGYEYRAFNIFKAGKTELKGQYSQIFDGFHIYVPNSQMAGLTPKSDNAFYSSDKTLFKNNYLNIDAFERIHLDPITGFYKCDSYYELTNSYVDDTAKKFLCTCPFYSSNNDLPENTVIVVDNGYQWRSDCWGANGSYSPRPGNVSDPLTRLNSSFWQGFRRRTFNISSTSSGYVGQNYTSFMNHLRIYVPVSDDIEIEREDTVSMFVIGQATLNSTGAYVYGSSTINIAITLHGDSTSNVSIRLDGVDNNASHYAYNSSTGNITIYTEGNEKLGNVTGIVDRDAGTISNLTMDGSYASFVTNNGSITCSELWHDRCNYSSNNASQQVWQRWYMSGSWTANTGSGEWTTSSTSYLLDNNYSMGLRIANNSYKQTRFTLKQDLGGGAGISARGVCVWLYNPNGNVYNSFRIYAYTSASTSMGSYVNPGSDYDQAIELSSLDNGQWQYIKADFGTTVSLYNISLFFQSTTSDTTYVYLGHVSIY